MKKGIKLTIGISAITLLLASLPTTVAVLVFGSDTLYKDTYLAGMKLKRDLLKETEGKRIVLIGGSSLAFGVRSPLIEKEFPEYKVVNFGLYGALGSECMLDLALPHIKKDDLVVLSFEQNAQTLSTYFSAMDMWQAIDDCKDAYWDLDESDRQAMVPASIAFAQQKLSYQLSSSAPKGDGAYAYENFNSNGDIDCDIPTGNALPHRYDPNQLIDFGLSLWEEDFIKEVNDFSKQVSAKGANTFYWFCPCNESALINPWGIDAYYQALSERLSFTILGNPHHSLFDPGYFFDSNFHLNNAGAINNTKRMVTDLKAELKIAKRTEIEEQPIPLPIVPYVDIEGDNSDLAFFNVEVDGDAATIKSLTEDGKKKESLVVPSSFEGKPITRFDVSTFQGNNAIKKLILQGNILEIADFSFTNTTGLTRIELRNPKPSTIQIGSHLLDGTNAKLYVPKESLGAYRSHYFFSAYASRIKALD